MLGILGFSESWGLMIMIIKIYRLSISRNKRLDVFCLLCAEVYDTKKNSGRRTKSACRDISYGFEKRLCKILTHLDI